MCNGGSCIIRNLSSEGFRAAWSQTLIFVIGVRAERPQNIIFQSQATFIHDIRQNRFQVLDDREVGIDDPELKQYCQASFSRSYGKKVSLLFAYPSRHHSFTRVYQSWS